MEDNKNKSFEMYFSVDIECDGDAPGQGSMLSIGISAMHPDTLEEIGTFYKTLKRLPDAKTSANTMAWWDERPEYYLAARKDAVDPAIAMKEMHDWVKRMCRVVMRDGKGPIPVFVAYPASFDFSFVYYYCHRFLGECIFSFSALDLKSYAMGMLGIDFIATKKDALPIDTDLPITHHALEDAQSQADLFRKLVKWRRRAKLVEPPKAKPPFMPPSAPEPSTIDTGIQDPNIRFETEPV
jgi:hypothetical protein